MQRTQVYRLCFDAAANHFCGAGDQLLFPFADLVAAHLKLRAKLDHGLVLKQSG